MSVDAKSPRQRDDRIGQQLGSGSPEAVRQLAQ
jgi:hypothetical protein